MPHYEIKEDPKFNGPHNCPRCGSESEWRGPNGLDMIDVQCRGDCGHYTMAHEQLASLPHFKEI